MDMFGKVGLVEVPILIAPDQKAWMDRMIKEGKIAIPPGGTLEKRLALFDVCPHAPAQRDGRAEASGSLGCGGRGRRRIEQVAENSPQHRSRSEQALIVLPKPG